MTSMGRETHFSSAVLWLRNMGGVKCQQFLKHSKHSNHWKWTLKMIFNGSRCFQFPEAVVTSTAKDSLCSTVLTTSSRCLGVETAVYKLFGSEGKHM